MLLHTVGLGENSLDIERPKCIEGQYNPETEPDICHGIDQKSFGGRAASRFSVGGVRDQEVRTEAHHLPTDQQHQEVPTHDQQDHGEGKQGDDRKEAMVSRVPDHVPGGIHMHDTAHSRNQEQKQDRELINKKVEIDGQRS